MKIRTLLLTGIAASSLALHGVAMADSNGNEGDDNDSIDIGDVTVDVSEDNRTDYIETGDIDIDDSTNLETGDIAVDASEDNRTDYVEVGDVDLDTSTNVTTGDVLVDNSLDVTTGDIAVDTGDDTRHDYVEVGDVTVDYDSSETYTITFDSYNAVDQTVGNASSTVNGTTVAVAAYIPINAAANATNNLENIREIQATAVASNVANSISVGGISVGNR